MVAFPCDYGSRAAPDIRSAGQNPCIEKTPLKQDVLSVEAPPRLELGVEVLQTSALPLGYGAMWSGRRDSNSRHPPWQGGTLPLSYYRTWCLGAESNHRHVDFQSTALPTELPRHMATRMGFEPTTSSVTGWHSNHLNYRATMVGTTGFEPVTPCL